MISRLFLLFTLVTAASLAGCGHKVATPPMIHAEVWGSDPDPITWERLQIPDTVTIHHAGTLWTESDDAQARTKNLQSWGKQERNWPDLPYHFLIAPDGTTFEGRPTYYEPESNTDYDLNGHVGIQLWGNFEEQRVSEEQLAATVELVAWLCQEHDIDPSTIQGHKHAAPGQTVCPGKDLVRYIESGLLAKWVEDRMRGRDPEIRLLPPLPGGPTAMIPGAG